jgi:hypothetical protein
MGIASLVRLTAYLARSNFTWSCRKPSPVAVHSDPHLPLVSDNVPLHSPSG